MSSLLGLPHVIAIVRPTTYQYQTTALQRKGAGMLLDCIISVVHAPDDLLLRADDQRPHVEGFFNTEWVSSQR